MLRFIKHSHIKLCKRQDIANIKLEYMNILEPYLSPEYDPTLRQLNKAAQYFLHHGYYSKCPARYSYYKIKTLNKFFGSVK